MNRIAILEAALKECTDRLESCIASGGTDPEYAAVAVAIYRDLLREERAEQIERHPATEVGT